MTTRRGTGAGRHAPLDMSADEFRRLGHQLVDQVAEAFESLPDRAVTTDPSPAAVRESLGLGRPLPDAGTPAGELLNDLVPRLVACSLFNAHPRFFGYVTASPAPVGTLGDFIASALNPNVGSWNLAPAATEIEAETVGWIAGLLGCPAGTGGLLVSGGNMANIVGFVTGRTARAPWDVRARGTVDEDGRRLAVYASSETHIWIQKAADLCGLGTDAIRWIPTGSDLRMDVDALTGRIDQDHAEGHVPILVVGTAGSVSTGAVDPLPEIARLCRERDLWFHVDGAYGGFAAGVDGTPADLLALSEADSIAVDPHKWLYAPLEAGCALVRDPAHLENAFAYHPAYYHFDERVTNFVDLGPQNSRGFRALKVWLALRQAGSQGYRTMIGDDMRLSRMMADAIVRHGELELRTQSLSVTTFRFVPADLRESVGSRGTGDYLNQLNTALLARIQRDGELFVSNAIVQGTYLLRACIVNFHTSEADVKAVPDLVVRAGRALDEKMRKGT